MLSPEAERIPVIRESGMVVSSGAVASTGGKMVTGSFFLLFLQDAIQTMKPIIVMMVKNVFFIDILCFEGNVLCPKLSVSQYGKSSMS